MPSFVSRSVLLLFAMFLMAGCHRSQEENGKGSGNSGESSRNSDADRFLSLMNAGKGYLDQGDPTNAIASYRTAATLLPNDIDLHLNLAISYLMAGDAPSAIREAEIVLGQDADNVAGWFIQGSAHLRMGSAEAAVKALENARKIEPGQTPVLFQLGMARMGLRQWDAAASAFQEGIAVDPNHLHAAAHYQLGLALLRAGRTMEAQQELQLHENGGEGPGGVITAASFERSKYTQARVPFKLEQPDSTGIPLRYVDASTEVFPESGSTLGGPVGLIDVRHDGWTSLFVRESASGFRLLQNTRGKFRAETSISAARAGTNFSKVLVGDLQNDRFDDILLLGHAGSQLYQVGSNGVVTDVSEKSGLARLSAVDGTLMDLDFTGKLDLLAVNGNTHQLQLLRQTKPLEFHDVSSNSGIPDTLVNAVGVVMEDWKRDENMDLIVPLQQGPPLFLEKQRGGKLIPRQETNWGVGTIIATGDFDNDLRVDLAVVEKGKIGVCFNGGSRKEIPLPADAVVSRLVAVDYDNDGWLDLWTVGDRVRVWRNTGLSGFTETTSQIGLDRFRPGTIGDVLFADFDRDCDPDAIVVLKDGGLRYLRNDGGNANSQIKLHLFGNRSNASGLGCKVEVASGGLRLIRTVHQLPVEIGVGRQPKVDSLLVHWFNWPQGFVDLGFDCKEPVFAGELTLQEGSCPYLYAWNGDHFEFVTDILGAAPLGLPLSEARRIESDPEELVWIGTEKTFVPRDDQFQLEITEELREVLYLDEASLVVVDHEPDTEVHPTSKLLPGGPFPTPTLLTLHREHPLVEARNLDQVDVTESLRRVDGKRASPPRLRSPQLRGLAEPHGYILDFGPLDSTQALVLVMNGWLRFGGGMANIAASHDPSLPFPFPTLEAEVAPNLWQPVPVTVGAPAGKTKTILVDLEGKLPHGTRRLRLKEAFEIHWDSIALMEKQSGALTRITTVRPTKAVLRERGFSRLRPLPTDCPPTPDHDAVTPNSVWTIIPEGWCTRYGDVSELVLARDEGLALVQSGDALTLSFDSHQLPQKRAGALREFFLHVDGWDKDSDFHVISGTQVEPLPFHGLNDQAYGTDRRPPFPSDILHSRYNTRWVEGKALKQTARRATATPVRMSGM